MKKTLIVHDQDPDGLLSAAIVSENTQSGLVSFHPALYYEDPPFNLIDKSTTVYIVDFSYKREKLKEVAEKAEKIVLLDHHRSTLKDLEDFNMKNVEIVLDMNRSGCQIAWDYFNTNKESPPIVKYVQDYDLWQWQMPFSEEINCGLSIIPPKISDWKRAYAKYRDDLEEVKKEGDVVVRYQNKIIETIIQQPLLMEIDSHIVPAINTFDPTLVSKLGNHLCQEHPFAAVFHLTNKGTWKFSLRASKESEIDVCKIATKFGGGGHKKAAGFQVETLPVIHFKEKK